MKMSFWGTKKRSAIIFGKAIQKFFFREIVKSEKMWARVKFALE